MASYSARRSKKLQRREWTIAFWKQTFFYFEKHSNLVTTMLAMYLVV
jgi:hypothetical protein